MKAIAERPAESAGEFAALAAAVHPAWHQAIIRLANASERVAFRLEALMGTPLDRGMAHHAREFIKDMIDLLDQMDSYASTELEEDISADLEEGGDGEPSLGSVGLNEWSNQTRWASGNLEDREDEHDGREPDVDDEPSLCGVTVTPGDGGRDLEADLGSLDRQMDQRRSLAVPSIWCATDGECA